MKTFLWLTACLVALPLYAADRDPGPADRYPTTSITTNVAAIDRDARTVTLVDRDGNEVTLYAEPELAAFDGLDVGDEVTFHYALPVALQVHKLDHPATSGSRGQTFYGSAVPPNGLPAEKVTERVTIEDVDASDDTITFMDEDGHRRMVAAENHALLKDLHRGDPIDITYTPWLLVGVD